MGHGRAPGEAWVQVARKGAVWTCMVASEDSSARLGRSRRSSGLSTVLSLSAAGPSWSTTRSTWRLPAPQRISTWSSAHPPQLPSTQLWVSQGHRGLSKDWIGGHLEPYIVGVSGLGTLILYPQVTAFGSCWGEEPQQPYFSSEASFLSYPPLSCSSNCLPSVSQPRSVPVDLALCSLFWRRNLREGSRLKVTDEVRSPMVPSRPSPVIYK